LPWLKDCTCKEIRRDLADSSLDSTKRERNSHGYVRRMVKVDARVMDMDSNDLDLDLTLV
jgi:hypothetical protein